jgi:hypothetical protein
MQNVAEVLSAFVDEDDSPDDQFAQHVDGEETGE